MSHTRRVVSREPDTRLKYWILYYYIYFIANPIQLTVMIQRRIWANPETHLMGALSQLFSQHCQNWVFIRYEKTAQIDQKYTSESIINPCSPQLSVSHDHKRRKTKDHQCSRGSVECHASDGGRVSAQAVQLLARLRWPHLSRGGEIRMRLATKLSDLRPFPRLLNKSWTATSPGHYSWRIPNKTMGSIRRKIEINNITIMHAFVHSLQLRFKFIICFFFYSTKEKAMIRCGATRRYWALAEPPHHLVLPYKNINVESNLFKFKESWQICAPLLHLVPHSTIPTRSWQAR